MPEIEIRLVDKDREALGGPEWVSLDVDRLMDTPAHMLERWELECGYPVERAVAECALSYPPAKAVHVLVWLARKQHGANVDAFDEDGKPEGFARLKDIRTMGVRIRDKEPDIADLPDGDDVDPPDSPGPSSPAEP